MTMKDALREAKRLFGSTGTAENILRAVRPCKVGIKGVFALDVRGEGDTWDEALAQAQAGEISRLDTWRRAREARIARGLRWGQRQEARKAVRA